MRIRVALLVVVALALGFGAYALWRSQRVGPFAFGDRTWVTSVARDFSDPFGVAVAPDGSIYVADAGRSQSVRRIAPDLGVTTLAGGERGFRDGPAATARFDT